MQNDLPSGPSKLPVCCFVSTVQCRHLQLQEKHTINKQILNTYLAGYLESFSYVQSLKRKEAVRDKINPCNKGETI